MANYQSRYSGIEIDENLGKASTSVQGILVGGEELPKTPEGKVEIPSQGGVVRYDEGQSLTDLQMQQARENIGAIGGTQEVFDDALEHIEQNATKISNLQRNKQEVIGDLSSIRSGASKGATSVQPAELQAVRQIAEDAKSIAEGAERAYVFDTKGEMDAWILEHRSELHIGDNLLIRDDSVPDYWWDGTQALELDAKIDLSNYLTSEQIAQLYATKVEVDKKIQRVELIYRQGSNTITLLTSQVALTYEQVASMVADRSNFVTLLDTDGEYLLPQYDDGAAIIFTGLNIFSTGTYAHRIGINLENEVKAEYYELALKSELDTLQLKVGRLEATKQDILTAEQLYNIDNAGVAARKAEQAAKTVEAISDKVETIVGFDDIGAFSPLKEYGVNDICLRSGQVWRCIAPHFGEWDAADFVRTSLAELVKVMASGSKEDVTIHFLTDETAEIVWIAHKVVVENISAGYTFEQRLTEDGLAIFSIPKGDMYQVSFPLIDPFSQPADRTFIANSDKREFEIIYSREILANEQVNIHAVMLNYGEEGHEVLDGAIFRLVSSSGIVIDTATMQDGLCVLNVPYKTHYTILVPDVNGYTHDHKADEHTAGIHSRDVLITYKSISYGVFGIDENGKRYATEQILNMSSAEKERIIAIGYNDSFLQTADRGDGTTGCGFCFKVGGEKAPTNLQWATENREFDTSRLPFITSDAMGLPYCAGGHYTELIMEIGAEMGIQTPAATHCAEQTLTIGGVDRQGFLPAYGQLRRLALNQNDLNAIYAALGKTAPTINSGNWWTACQGSATNAVNLLTGSFFNSYTKTYYNTVLRAFDL